MEENKKTRKQTAYGTLHFPFWEMARGKGCESGFATVRYKLSERVEFRGRSRLGQVPSTLSILGLDPLHLFFFGISALYIIMYVDLNVRFFSPICSHMKRCPDPWLQDRYLDYHLKR